MTHTRTSTTAGPDYCAECWEAAQAWVKWPCPVVEEAPSTLASEDERDTVVSWIRGIRQGVWQPTPATKRHLADVLQRMLHGHEAEAHVMASHIRTEGTELDYETMALNALARSWELTDRDCQRLALMDAQVWATLHATRGKGATS